jgi:L-lactate dehydrogenase complex protein LldG
MNNRDAILKDLRRNAPPLAPLPEYPSAITYEDPEAQFAETFTSVGGTFFRVADFVALDAELRNLELYTRARKIVSLVPGAGASTVDVSGMKAPHQLEGVDLGIIEGEFGVAENGAVWVPGRNLGPQRAIYVISEHLVLIVPAGQIVHTMQHAYDRIRFERPGFGLFISGPSKTADIEQSLVIGAHGPRSCTLFLVG